MELNFSPHLFSNNTQKLYATVLDFVDPPKSLSDVVESMFGAAHVDGGFEAGQHAVGTVMDPILDALRKALLTRNNSTDLKTKAREMMHPKQYVHELAGGILNVKAWQEEDFAIRRRHCPVWRNGDWITCEGTGNNSIGLIESFGIDLVGIEEKTSHIARNRACAMAMEVFETNTDLITKLKSFSQLLRPKEVVEEEDKEDDLKEDINEKDNTEEENAKEGNMKKDNTKEEHTVNEANVQTDHSKKDATVKPDMNM